VYAATSRHGAASAASIRWGASANAYDYCYQNTLTCTDTTGKFLGAGGLDTSDVVFGVPVNRRMGLPLAGTVGNFVVMVPMRIDLGQAASLIEAMHATYSGISAGFAHTDLDYDEITKLIPPALLREALAAVGMVNYPTEWWQWSYGDRYWALSTGAGHALYAPTQP
jgi:hypothetical protein